MSNAICQDQQICGPVRETMRGYEGKIRGEAPNPGRKIMKSLAAVLAALFGWLAVPQTGLAQESKIGVERLYVLYCGDIALTDMGRFSPGYSGPGALSVTCYLVKHGQDWLLWDTGLGDAIVSMPDGQKSKAMPASGMSRRLSPRSLMKSVSIRPISNIWRYRIRIPITSAISSCLRNPHCWCRRPNMTGPTHPAARAFHQASRPSRPKATMMFSVTAA